MVRVLGEVVFWSDEGVMEGGFAVPTEDVGITVSFFVSFLQASEATVIVFPNNLGCSLTVMLIMSCIFAEVAE